MQLQGAYLGTLNYNSSTHFRPLGGHGNELSSIFPELLNLLHGQNITSVQNLY